MTTRSLPSDSNKENAPSTLPKPIPGSGNLLPMFDNQSPGTEWDYWIFDGLAVDDRALLGVSLNRNLDPRRPGSCKVEILVVWPDQSTFNHELFFDNTKFVEAEGGEDVVGTWFNTSDASSVSFRVRADCSHATVNLDVPGVVQGKMHLVRLPGDTGLDTPAELSPSVGYLQPLGRASVTASLTVASSNTTGGRYFQLGEGNEARGGIDRCWSPFAWHQVMKESYRARAIVGPYSMSVLRISSRPTDGSPLYTSSRLYRDGVLVCVAHRAPEDPDEDGDDFLSLSKVYEVGEKAITGAFHDKCTGYQIIFGSSNGQRWRFNVQHGTVLYNTPTSPPGPEATGISGFMEFIKGGEEGEEFEGVGFGSPAEFFG
ncbi:hypothetical protein BJY04DRAFT_191028 [Aspergillus karnatakaensis]|uniref:uncharacterized protein n=1 Tax=Aspergillus karnatakaensis TaxID=1810916 RepID=UPI003CCE1F57